MKPKNKKKRNINHDKTKKDYNKRYFEKKSKEIGYCKLYNDFLDYFFNCELTYNQKYLLFYLYTEITRWSKNYTYFNVYEINKKTKISVKTILKHLTMFEELNMISREGKMKGIMKLNDNVKEWEDGFTKKDVKEINNINLSTEILNNIDDEYTDEQLIKMLDEI